MPIKSKGGVYVSVDAVYSSSPGPSAGEFSGCCFCLMACPTGAAGPVSPKTVAAEKCTGCGKCVDVCPSNCRVMRDTC